MSKGVYISVFGGRCTKSPTLKIRLICTLYGDVILQIKICMCMFMRFLYLSICRLI
jgi:hypothetical protein